MELWDAYDADGNLAGRDLLRGRPVPDGLYHLVASVLVEHQDGTYLLMRRDPRKPNWPGVFEASAGGSALKGETAAQAARRELREETGITVGQFTPLYEERGSHMLYRGFLCRTDWPKEAIALQEGETVEFCWVDRKTLLEMAARCPRILVAQTGVLAYLNEPAFKKEKSEKIP